MSEPRRFRLKESNRRGGIAVTASLSFVASDRIMGFSLMCTRTRLNNCAIWLLSAVLTGEIDPLLIALTLWLLRLIASAVDVAGTAVAVVAGFLLTSALLLPGESQALSCCELIGSICTEVRVIVKYAIGIGEFMLCARGEIVVVFVLARELAQRVCSRKHSKLIPSDFLVISQEQTVLCVLGRESGGNLPRQQEYWGYRTR